MHSSTFVVRKMYRGGFSAEKVFISTSPWLRSIEIIGSSVVRRSKLYFLRNRAGKAARLKTKNPLPSKRKKKRS